MSDPLRARLFGYGVPYRVEVDGAGAVAPRTTDAAGEAARLCHALGQLRVGWGDASCCPMVRAEHLSRALRPLREKGEGDDGWRLGVFAAFWALRHTRKAPRASHRPLLR